MTVVVNPTIGFKVNDILSVGAGIDYMYGKAELSKTPFSAALGGVNVYNLDLKADGDAWGYNFGLLLKPTENLRIGASYRSPFTLKLKDGDVDLSNITGAAGGVVQGVFGGTTFSTKGTATLSLPATLALGVSYTTGKLTVNADADWTFWHSYSSLPIEIRDQRSLGPTPLLISTNSGKKWKDVVAIRIGTEYRVTEPLALRAGFVYDPTPAPGSTVGPELPDADRLNYMVGAGYKIGPWTIDGALMYVDKNDRTVSNQRLDENGLPAGQNGTWTGDAWLVGLDVGYNF
jgi:long-chain fatty acid transport protein